MCWHKHHEVQCTDSTGNIQLTYLLTYVLTPWSRVLLENLNGIQLVNKFREFYGPRRVTAAFTSVPILSQLDPVNTPTPHFLKIHLTIILPSTLGFARWLFSVTFPHQNPVLTSPLPHTRYMLRSSNSSRFYHPKILSEE